MRKIILHIIAIQSVMLITQFFIIETAFSATAPKTDTAVNAAPVDDPAGQDAGETDNAPDRSLPDLKPGGWEPLFELGESIYPSVVISTATLKEGLWNDERHMGEPWGMVGVAVRGTEKNCPVKVEISGGSFIRPSIFTGTLPDDNLTYCVYPDLDYDYERLLAVKQTIPESLTFKVTIGKETLPERKVRVQVRPVNECLFAFEDSLGNQNDCSFFFAGYVNENHPFINEILKEALAANRVESFSGYSGDTNDEDSVLEEIRAVWDTLKARGMRYSAMPASADDDSPYLGTQYVRLLGESINYSQANCVDGSVLMASILRKIGLDVSLVQIPQHMFIAVNLDQEGNDTVFIETTELGDSTLDEAIEEGNKQYAENKDKFDSEKDEDHEYAVINIQNARVLGIIPIKDASVSRQ